MLSNTDWRLAIDVSGQPLGHFFEDKGILSKLGMPDPWQWDRLVF